MVGPRIYHVHQTRRYETFANPSTAFEAMNSWMRSSDFKVRRRSHTFSRGSKRGVHVNFVPKFKLLVEPVQSGGFIVKFDYYGKLKIGTAVVVGVLTSGISTAVGVATYAVRLLEADKFAASFWAFVDSLARGPIQVVKVERWGHDKHGNYVQQPQAVVAPQPVIVQQPVVMQQQPYVLQQPYVVHQPYPVYQHQQQQQQQPYMQQQSPVKTRDGYPGLSSSTGSVPQQSTYTQQQPYPQQSYPQQPYSQQAYSSQPGSVSTSTTYADPTYAPDQHHIYGHPSSPYTNFSQMQFTPPPSHPTQVTQQVTTTTTTQPQQPLQQQSSQSLLHMSDSQPQQYYPVLDNPAQAQSYYSNVDSNAYPSGYPQVSTTNTTSTTSSNQAR